MMGDAPTGVERQGSHVEVGIICSHGIMPVSQYAPVEGTVHTTGAASMKYDVFANCGVAFVRRFMQNPPPPNRQHRSSRQHRHSGMIPSSPSSPSRPFLLSVFPALMMSVGHTGHGIDTPLSKHSVDAPSGRHASWLRHS